MGKHDVVVFKPYPFRVGEKLNIEEGPRRGDWEVIVITSYSIHYTKLYDRTPARLSASPGAARRSTRPATPRCR